MIETTGVIASPGAREISFVRFFMVSPERVFDAWTRPARLRKWWGPEDLELVTCELDPRPGGSSRLAFRAPDGKLHASHGTYLEVERPIRLSFSEVLDDAPGETFLTSVTFEEMGAMTRMTVRQTAAITEPLATGQLTGWLESLTRLSELLLPG